MHRYSLTHLADRTLLHELAALVAQDRGTTARLLAHLAEVDERKLYLPAAYSSLYAYCVGELRMSEDSAFKRIRGARAARRFPSIFECIAEGRLHLSAVVLLAPYLTAKTADELLAEASNKTRAELEQLLARRFPQPDLPTRIEAISPSLPTCQLAPGPVQDPVTQLSPGTVVGSAQVSNGVIAPHPATVQAPAPRPRVAPLAPERFALQLTIGKSTHDKLRYAQSLLGHTVPSGDIAEVLDRALDELIHKLEQTKLAATSKPRPGRRAARDIRHVPAHVKRTVWARDRGQCTFVANDGRRCAERTRLEFDHTNPVARGGVASVGQIRLRCRAHNQYAAECEFGAGFIQHKREQASRAATTPAGGS